MPRLPLLSLTLPIVLVVAGCSRQSHEQVQQKETAASPAPQASESEAEVLNGTLDRSHAGEPLPDVTISGANGIKLNLAELKGAPLLVNLWATWCAPCIAEMPKLDWLAGQPGMPRVLAVSEDLKGAAVVNPFLQQHQFLNLQPSLDPDNLLATGYQANLPTTVLYNAQGKEVWRMQGGYDWSSDKAKALVQEGLAKS